MGATVLIPRVLVSKSTEIFIPTSTAWSAETHLIFLRGNSGLEIRLSINSEVYPPTLHTIAV